MACATIISFPARAGVPVFGGRAAADPRADAWSSAALAAPDGSPLRLADIPTPLVFVNLWASWCPACLAELGPLQSMASTLGGATVSVIMVGHPANAKADLAYARSRQLPFPAFAFAPGTPAAVVGGAFGADAGGHFAVPQSLVFGGFPRRLLRSVTGPADWDSPEEAASLLEMAESMRREG
jgi:thiol-disulfide isomerase/thioredoxin